MFEIVVQKGKRLTQQQHNNNNNNNNKSNNSNNNKDFFEEATRLTCQSSTRASIYQYTYNGNTTNHVYTW